MRISDWSSDVCSSDLAAETLAKIDFFMVASPFQKGDNHRATAQQTPSFTKVIAAYTRTHRSCRFFACHSPTTYRSGIRPEKLNEPHFNSCSGFPVIRSDEHTSELQSLMRISYSVFCSKKKKFCIR